MKCLAILLTIAALGLVRGSVVPKDRNINDILPGALERFRDNMPGGILDGTLVLSPLSLEEVAVDFTVYGLFHVDGPLSPFLFEGLEKFQANQMSYDYETSRLNYDIVIPDTRTTGWMNLIGNMAGFIPIFGTGNFHFNAEWRMHGYVEIGRDDSDHLTVSDFFMRLSVRNVDSHYEGLLGGGELGDLMNVMMQDFSMMLLDKFHGAISANMDELVRPWLHGLINVYTWETFLDLLENN